MMTKCVFVAIFSIIAVSEVSAGVVPVASAAIVAPYATSYNAHSVNHAVAAPLLASPAVVSSPYVAGPAVVSSPYLAGPAGLSSPYLAAPAGLSSPYLAAPAAYSAYSYPGYASAYSAYSGAYPALSAPLIAG